MSYDLYLYRTDNEIKPFKSGEIENKLKDSTFAVNEFVEDGYATGFDVKLNFDDEPIEFYHQAPENNCYSTSISYGISEEHFETLVNDIAKIVKKLELLIGDPQTTNMERNLDLLDSENFAKERLKRNRVFKNALNVLQNINFVIPSEKKHFILYFITTEDPTTKNVLILLTENGQFAASKVNEGESIAQVVGREMTELTGQDVYKILSVASHDVAFDRLGNELQRYAVTLKVPYFDPSKAKTKQSMKWRDFEIDPIV